MNDLTLAAIALFLVVAACVAPTPVADPIDVDVIAAAADIAATVIADPEADVEEARAAMVELAKRAALEVAGVDVSNAEDVVAAARATWSDVTPSPLATIAAAAYVRDRPHFAEYRQDVAQILTLAARRR